VLVLDLSIVDEFFHFGQTPIVDICVDIAGPGNAAPAAHARQLYMWAQIGDSESRGASFASTCSAQVVFFVVPLFGLALLQASGIVYCLDCFHSFFCA
jgi:hypothetical protein